MTINQKPLIEMRNITKKFPGCVALDNVDFELQRGEVHVLFGENGAGKTTLIKILSGVFPPDKGNIYMKGKEVRLKNCHHARSLGISAVYQEFSLVPELSVIVNLFLGRELYKGFLLDKKEMAKQAHIYLKKLKLRFDVNFEEKAGNISLAQQQLVEIVKGLMQEVSIMILDEPTASLSDAEKPHFFDIIRRLKEEGIGIVYISHVMDEIKEIGDKVTILRDGKKIAVLENKEDVSEETLVKSIIGKRKEKIFPKLETEFADKVLEVKNLSTENGLKNISFDLRAGEILGIGGLPDSGKSNVGRALFGLEKITEGEIILFGEEVTNELTPAEAFKKNLAYTPTDKLDGLVLCRDIRENMTLPSLLGGLERRGFIKKVEEEKAVSSQIKGLDIKPSDMNRTVQYLSGGNQQKVLIARSLLKEAKVFVFDEVTRGVDVGTKLELYKLITELAKKGAAIVFISSEIPELLHLCHSILVMYEFSIFKKLNQKDATRDKLVHYLFKLEVED